MALRQVTVPWVRGYNAGVGADLASGSPMGKVVAGEATPVTGAGGSVVDFQVQRIQSTEDLESALGIDVEASYGCAAFGAGVSARFSFAKDSKIQSSSLFMSITVQVELAFLSIDSPALAPEAAAIVDRDDVFEARYGNMFVRGIGRGGLFVGVLRVDTRSSQESSEIASELAGAYGLFSAEAEAKFKDVQKKYRSEVFVRMYHEGGPTNLRIDDPADPLNLLRNANAFLEGFHSNPEECARPYFVTLAPVTIALGPLPPNLAQLQHAQDVIVYCAKRRSALLDQLNLLDYVLDNPSRYDFSNGASVAALRTASEAVQADLDLVASCASSAMNDRASAKMPAEYAASQGRTFPSATLLDPMPIAVRTEDSVTIPDFRGCSTWNACRELATRSGLTLTWEYQGTEPAAFKVIDFRPPAGTVQPKGSVVTIICPPDPPSVGAVQHIGNVAGRPWLQRIQR